MKLAAICDVADPLSKLIDSSCEQALVCSAVQIPYKCVGLARACAEYLVSAMKCCAVLLQPSAAMNSRWERSCIAYPHHVS